MDNILKKDIDDLLPWSANLPIDIKIHYKDLIKRESI